MYVSVNQFDNLRWKTTFDGRRALMEDDLWLKTSFYGRWPLLKDDLRWKTTLDWIQPSMEDNLQWKTTFIGGQLCIKRFLDIPPLQSFLEAPPLMLIYLLFYFIANTRVYFSSVQLVLFYFVANTTSWTERNHTWVLLSSSSYHGEHWPPSCMVAPIHLIYLQTHSTAPVYSTPPLTCSLLHALSAALVLTCPHCYQVDRTHSASQTCNGINNLGFKWSV